MSLFLSDAEAQSTPDTSRHVDPVPTFVQQPVTFPEPTIRFTMAGMAIVLLGGLAYLLNEKKKQADKRLGLD